MFNNDNNKNNLKYYHTTLFDCKFQAGFEERREQEYRLFSFKTTKQRLKMSKTLLCCWQQHLYAGPPQLKVIGFFFHSTSWSFISCSVWTILCSSTSCVLNLNFNFNCMLDFGNLHNPKTQGFIILWRLILSLSVKEGGCCGHLTFIVH